MTSGQASSSPKSRRILVALDNSPRGLAALQAALKIALESSLELQGLFIEDEDLLRLAGLPFACEVEFGSATSRHLQTLSMERSLRAAAEETQQAFTRALSQAGLPWTFRVVRGPVDQVLLAAAGEDLLVVGNKGRYATALTTRLELQRLRGRGLDCRLTKPERASQVLVLLDGSPAAFRALELASHLAKDSPIHIFVVGSQSVQTAHDCHQWLADQQMDGVVSQLKPNELIGSLRGADGIVMLANRGSEIFEYVSIGKLLNEIDCPLILC